MASKSGNAFRNLAVSINLNEQFLVYVFPLSFFVILFFNEKETYFSVFSLIHRKLQLLCDKLQLK